MSTSKVIRNGVRHKMRNHWTTANYVAVTKYPFSLTPTHWPPMLMRLHACAIIWIVGGLDVLCLCTWLPMVHMIFIIMSCTKQFHINVHSRSTILYCMGASATHFGSSPRHGTADWRSGGGYDAVIYWPRFYEGITIIPWAPRMEGAPQWVEMIRNRL